MGKRMPLYEDATGICVTYVLADDKSHIEFYAEVPTENGFDVGSFRYPEDRFHDINMSVANMRLFQDTIEKCRLIIKDIWDLDCKDARAV